MNYNPKPICEESKHCPKPTWGNLKEKVTPPNDYQSTGRPSGMMRMTWKETRRKDKKRSTPKDVENEKKGIYRGSKPRKRARKPTVEENRANKMTSVITSAELISIRPWSLFISDELRQMNRGKEGRPFEYPDSMFVWIMLFMGYLGLTYGKAAGLAKETLEDHGMGSPSLSTVFRRIIRIVRSLVISAPPEDSRILCMYANPRKVHRHRTVAVDSSGFNLIESFDWCTEKWGTLDGNAWLKLHVMADVDTGEILSFILTYNDVGDSTMLPLLMERAVRAGHRISAVYADGAYGSDGNWRIVSSEYRCRFITSFKVNTRPNNNGCLARGEAARCWCALPYDEWVEMTGYGRRWKVECVFSDIKRLISECFRSKTDTGHIVQAYAKVASFNIHKANRAEIIGVTGNGIKVSA